MIERKQYLDILKRNQNRSVIKVISGIRRCGKSTLLQLFRNYLEREQRIDSKRITFLNFEDVNNEHLLDYKKLHAYIEDRLQPKGMNYVFLDEVQHVKKFQKAVDSLYIKNNVDLYITGSNAQLLSGELATLLSGRYVEVRMLPLSFKEYYDFNGGDKRSCFEDYIMRTSFPYAVDTADSDVIDDYIRGIYSAVLLKDVVQRHKISDVTLLENLIKFLCDNIGSIVSAKKISDALSIGGRSTTPATVDNYISALCESFILYKCNRYDVKGKQYLKSLEKYYLVDIGFRHMLLGNRGIDLGHILENIVYLELCRRGYDVRIGKVGEKEVDFIASKNKEFVYYQVAWTIASEEVFEREFSVLESIRDHHKKVVLTTDSIEESHNGILKRNVIDFLLEE